MHDKRNVSKRDTIFFSLYNAMTRSNETCEIIISFLIIFSLPKSSSTSISFLNNLQSESIWEIRLSESLSHLREQTSGNEVEWAFFWNVTFFA